MISPKTLDSTSINYLLTQQDQLLINIPCVSCGFPQLLIFCFFSISAFTFLLHVCDTISQKMLRDQFPTDTLCVPYGSPHSGH